MQCIVYVRDDGGISIITPLEGARLASSVTVDGQKMETWIEIAPPQLLAPAIYEPDGETGVDILVSPAIYSDPVCGRLARPVDSFLRRWPVEGAVVEWAETEAEFVERIRAKDVPAGHDSILMDTADLPADRATRTAWRLVDGVVVVDPNALPPVVVRRLRVKLELADRNKLAAVEAAVAQAGTIAQLYWNEAAEFESDHPLVMQIGQAIGLDVAGIRELFIAARDRTA